jgi:hypothetical protein
LRSSYPLELLPQVNYKNRIDPEDLPKDSFFVRRLLIDSKSAFNAAGFIKIKALFDANKEYQFIECSFNLYGPFQEGHLKYRAKYPNWDKSRRCFLNSNSVIYDYVTPDDPVYLFVSKVNNVDFPYEKYCPVKNFIGTCKIEHVPTCANYWHFQIAIFDQEGNKIKGNSGGWKIRAAVNFIETVLKAEFKRLNPNQDFILNNSIYHSS